MAADGSQASADLAQLAAEMHRLELEAEDLHQQAQALNKAGDYAGANAKYKEFRRRDDEAIALALKIGELAPPAASLTSGSRFVARPLPLSADEQGKDFRQRAFGSVLGAVVADAAATGVQWVYDPAELDRLMQSVKARGLAGLEYLDPPASPHFDYEIGRNSPYGEQALVLLQSLAEQQRLDTFAYAETFASSFGGDWHVRRKGYRDASCKGFLRNWAVGKRPPESGARDKQINCCVRLPPLLAMFCDHPDLFSIVEQTTRTTQNMDDAVAWASVGTLVLQNVLQGQTPKQAVDAALCTVEAMQDDPLIPEKRADDLYLVAGHLFNVVRYSQWAPVKEAVRRMGKNCHTPNSYQTPVHAVLRHVGACEQLRNNPQRLEPAEAQAIFTDCVRAAMREGGCCASRCGVIGGILGAYLAGKCDDPEDFIPPIWRQRTLAYPQAKLWTQAILEARQTVG